MGGGGRLGRMVWRDGSFGLRELGFEWIDERVERGSRRGRAWCALSGYKSDDVGVRRCLLNDDRADALPGRVETRYVRVSKSVQSP